MKPSKLVKVTALLLIDEKKSRFTSFHPCTTTKVDFYGMNLRRAFTACRERRIFTACAICMP